MAANRNEKLVVALDADGCIYNPLYDYAIFCLIHEYLEFLRDEDVSKQDKVNKIEEMKEEIKKLFAYSQEYKKVGISKNRKETFPAVGQIRKAIFKKFDNPARLQELDEKEKIAKIKEKLCELKLEFFEIIKALDPNPELDTLYATILFESNYLLFEDLIDAADEFAELEITSASNRQNNELDSLNKLANGTGLFAEDLQLVIKLLNKQLNNSQYQFKSFSVANIYLEYFDDSKFVIHYPLLCESAKECDGQKKQLRLRIYDDRYQHPQTDEDLDILDHLKMLILNNRNLIHKKVSVELIGYRGDQFIPVTLSPIQGKGKQIDRDVENRMLSLCQQIKSKEDSSNNNNNNNKKQSKLWVTKQLLQDQGLREEFLKGITPPKKSRTPFHFPFMGKKSSSKTVAIPSQLKH